MRPDHPLGPMAPFPSLSEAERQATLLRALRQRPRGQGFWVFAYGSLMWRPDFQFHEKRYCRLPGYHRDFVMWTVVGRGSPDFPGLGLALDEGGTGVTGAAYRLKEDPDSFEADLTALWDREMTSGIYQPRWVGVESAEGPFEALAFVLDRRHPQYAGAIAFESRAVIIAHAVGKYGPCADYLAQTVIQLEKADAPDPGLSALHHRVREILALSKD